MDEAFSNLDDLSDKETLERLESLFETSLPPVSIHIMILLFLAGLYADALDKEL